jgi:hypothetical protein
VNYFEEKKLQNGKHFIIHDKNQKSTQTIGVKKRKVSRLAAVSRESVDKYERIFKAHPLEYSQLLRLSDKDLFSIISPPALEKPIHTELLALFPKMEQDLLKVGVTKLYLWEKYKERRNVRDR